MVMSGIRKTLGGKANKR